MPQKSVKRPTDCLWKEPLFIASDHAVVERSLVHVVQIQLGQGRKFYYRDKVLQLINPATPDEAKSALEAVTSIAFIANELIATQRSKELLFNNFVCFDLVSRCGLSMRKCHRWMRIH